MPFSPRVAWAIARKDIRGVTANLQVWLPIIVGVLMMGVILPAALTLVGRFADLSPGTSSFDPIVKWLERLPLPALKSALDAMPTFAQKMVFLMVNFGLAPMFLLLPVMSASTIAADSFAGEKERGTMESLLFAPVDLLTLFSGKTLAAFVPGVVVAWAAFVFYGLTVNILGWPLFGRIFFPTFSWLPLMLIVVPAFSLASVLFTVYISARVASFQAAYQMGPVLLIPVMGMFIGQLASGMLLGPLALTIIGLVLVVIDVLVTAAMLRRLSRPLLFLTQVR